MRLILPRMTMVFTSATLTLNSVSTADLISSLLALSATSKITLFASLRRVAFSVSAIGRLMMSLGFMITAWPPRLP